MGAHFRAPLCSGTHKKPREQRGPRLATSTRAAVVVATRRIYTAPSDAPYIHRARRGFRARRTRRLKPREGTGVCTANPRPGRRAASATPRWPLEEAASKAVPGCIEHGEGSHPSTWCMQPAADLSGGHATPLTRGPRGPPNATAQNVPIGVSAPGLQGFPGVPASHDPLHAGPQNRRAVPQLRGSWGPPQHRGWVQRINRRP